MPPRLLDLFCGAGGAAVGYSRAGFEVVGVDIDPQPHYPFEFIQADALDILDRHVYWAKEWGIPAGIDVIHASPPCQAYSWSARRWAVERADLVAPTRTLLEATGLPWVMENVVGAPLRNPMTLCGLSLGLPELLRHRRFESNLLLFPPFHSRHIGSVKAGDYITVAGHGGNNAKGRGSRSDKQRAMGIDWMDDEELNQAIPPAYTEWIGRQLLAAIERGAVA